MNEQEKFIEKMNVLCVLRDLKYKGKQKDYDYKSLIKECIEYGEKKGKEEYRPEIKQMARDFKRALKINGKEYLKKNFSKIFNITIQSLNEEDAKCKLIDGGLI